jgi:hypothetical protein
LEAAYNEQVLTLYGRLPADLPLLQARILPLVRPVLQSLGWTELPHIRVMPLAAATAAHTASPEMPIPIWIAAAHWLTLPLALRAVLLGSTLEQGSVRGATPMMTDLLTGRYRAEVALLLASAPTAQLETG